MTEILTRFPVPGDATAISAIDAQGLASGHASFREQPHDWSSFQNSFMEGRGLALVAEDNHGVVAWAGVSPTSKRAVYRGVGEVSIYVSPRKQKCGVGRILLDALVIASEQAGFWTLVAQIFPENKSSLSLHAGCGFDVVGTRKRLGQMSYGPCAGDWRDVIMLERHSPLSC
ncbi:N-acetyltransferase family protein [Roseibium sp.]|uniref:GNAT family N-acetyltransferase n=1 Tax=Roseibium sp. TaxID=1936156 RepID=UPI003D0D6770